MTPPTEATSFFGSDHRPVLARASGDAAGTSNGARIRSLLSEIRQRLEEVEALASQ